MAIYKYRFRRKTYFYFRVRIDDHSYSRRFNSFNKRFSKFIDAEKAELNFVAGFKFANRIKYKYVFETSSDFEDFLVSKYKPTSVYVYFNCFKNYVLPQLHDKKIADLNETDFIRLCEYLDNLPYRNKAKFSTTIKNFLIYLHRYDFVIPLDTISIKRSFSLFKAKKIVFWNKNEFDSFIKVVDSLYWKLLFTVLYFYGLRISELRALTFDCFLQDKLIVSKSLTNKTLKHEQTLSSTKTSSSNRIFPMLDNVWLLFCELKKEDHIKSDFVFHSMIDARLAIGETTIKRKIKKYCNLSGIKYIYPHAFRHSCASLLINSGMDALQVAQWLGHASPTITLSIYSHLFEVRKNDVYKFLNKII